MLYGYAVNIIMLMVMLIYRLL